MLSQCAISSSLLNSRDLSPGSWGKQVEDDLEAVPVCLIGYGVRTLSTVSLPFLSLPSLYEWFRGLVILQASLGSCIKRDPAL